MSLAKSTHKKNSGKRETRLSGSSTSKSFKKSSRKHRKSGKKRNGRKLAHVNRGLFRKSFPEQLVKGMMKGGSDDSPIREDIEIEFRTKIVDHRSLGPRIYSEIGVPKRQKHLFPQFAKIIEDVGCKVDCTTQILDSTQYWRICYLIASFENFPKDFLVENNYDGIEKLKPFETINKWIEVRYFYCEYTLNKDQIADRERSLFKGSGRMMFQKTMAAFDPEIPIWLEAHAGTHTLKDKHPLFNLYKSMGFELIGPTSNTDAEKIWNLYNKKAKGAHAIVLADGTAPELSKIGANKKKQIENLKWDAALMINLRGADGAK